MDIYCVSRNDPVLVVYLGTDLSAALDAVGEFQKYETALPENVHWHCALPNAVDKEFVHYYMADGWWYSIVKLNFDAYITPQPLIVHAISSAPGINFDEDFTIFNSKADRDREYNIIKVGMSQQLLRTKIPVAITAQVKSIDYEESERK